jgi:hypothetical protein
VKPRVHVVGVDDAPFAPDHRGDVPIVGAVFSGLRLDGVLRGRVRRDGANATRAIADMVQGSRFAAQLQAVLLQGIAVAGFNVVDLRGLHEELGIPVIAVARAAPDMEAVRAALLGHVPGGRRKWGLVVAAGAMERAGRVWIQRAGIPLAEARRLVERLAVNAGLPEPLRTAHLIAGGMAAGGSRHRA